MQHWNEGPEEKAQTSYRNRGGADLGGKNREGKEEEGIR
jgi:hypothetical protein